MKETILLSRSARTLLPLLPAAIMIRRQVPQRINGQSQGTGFNRHHHRRRGWPLLPAALLVMGGVIRAGDWPMPGRDKTRNPVSPDKGAHPVIKRHDQHHFLNTPVLCQDRIYIGGNDREMGGGPDSLFCIDPGRHGDVSHKLEAGPGEVRPNPNSAVVWHLPSFGRTIGLAAVHDGFVIAASYDGNVYCEGALPAIQPGASSPPPPKPAKPAKR